MTKIQSAQTAQYTPVRTESASSVRPTSSPESSSRVQRSERAVKPVSSRDQLVRGFRHFGIDHRQLGIKTDNPLPARVKQRIAMREQRRQNNLERILRQALDYAPDNSSHDDLDLDWLYSFLEQAQDITNGAMQKLWSKILATESARPGSFSLRTLTTLRQLTSREADTLRRAQALTCHDSRHNSYRIITGYYKKPNLFTWLTLDKPVVLNIARAGLNYPDLLTLSDLGILYPSAIESGEMVRGDALELTIANQQVTLSAKTKGLVMTYHKYTTQGEELLRLLPATEQAPYLNLVEERFSRDFTIEHQRSRSDKS